MDTIYTEVIFGIYTHSSKDKSMKFPCKRNPYVDQVYQDYSVRDQTE